jgi:2-amino-4-hydroxy-6-hydroxymethyldihydropteridine diphosphokinase
VTYTPRCDASESDLAFIGLGSNLDNPQRQLGLALHELVGLGKVVGRSRLYQSAPQGGPPGQPDYLNAVVALLPACTDPEQLLEGLLEIERKQGRVRRQRWAARTIDLDLLSWGSRVVASESLTLPHPRMMQRAFVLAPLCEVCPAWWHPISRISAYQALAGLACSGCFPTELPWMSG